jgi:hypothetical protein
METKMKTLIAGTLGACLLLPIVGAGAQAQPANVNVTPGALARFKLEAVSFRALHETGWDWTGSDEVYVSIHVPARKIATISQVFEDVDAGETKRIPSNQSCILPIAGVTGPKTLAAIAGDRWSCSPNGAPGPFSFTVVLREKDCCGFDHGFGPATEGLEPGPLSGTDDLIGRHKVEYSMEELTALHVGQVVEESVTLSSCEPTPEQPNTGCGSSAIDREAEYQFTWRLTRLPDAEPVVR